MFYNRFWFHKDLYGVTLGVGQISEPIRIHRGADFGPQGIAGVFRRRST